MNALGLPTPSVAVANTVGSGHHHEENVTFTADAGTFTISFTPSSGSPQTTTPIQFSATTDMSTALANGAEQAAGRQRRPSTNNGDGTYTITFVPIGTSRPSPWTRASSRAAHRARKSSNGTMRTRRSTSTSISRRASRSRSRSTWTSASSSAPARSPPSRMHSSVRARAATSRSTSAPRSTSRSCSTSRAPRRSAAATTSQTVVLNATGGSFTLTLRVAARAAAERHRDRGIRRIALGGDVLLQGHRDRLERRDARVERGLRGRRLDEPADRADVGRRHRRRQLPGLHAARRPCGENKYFMSERDELHGRRHGQHDRRMRCRRRRPPPRPRRRATSPTTRRDRHGQRECRADRADGARRPLRQGHGHLRPRVEDVHDHVRHVARHRCGR